MGPVSHSMPGLAYSDVVKGSSSSSLTPANPSSQYSVPFGHTEQDVQNRSLLSQALTIVDREFPSLSNNSQLPSTTQGSMWSTAGSRTISGPIQRNQPAPGPSQQGGQDDLFGPPSSRMQSNQGPFRFGAQPTQVQPNSVDDFPPLNRSSNGEIGSERGANLMSALGFNPQNPGPSGPMPNNGGNGLLNALTATNRANEVRSPPAIGTPNGNLASSPINHPDQCQFNTSQALVDSSSNNRNSSSMMVSRNRPCFEKTIQEKHQKWPRHLLKDEDLLVSLEAKVRMEDQPSAKIARLQRL